MSLVLKRITILLMITWLLLSACSSKTSSPTATQPPQDKVFTQAAQTIIAKLTQEESIKPKATATPLPTFTATLPATETPAVLPTNTPQPIEPTSTAIPPTEKPRPTHTPLPPTPKPAPCNQAILVKHVNYPIGSQVNTGTVIDKVWRIKNTGTCSWTSKYKLVLSSGDAMGSPTSLAWQWGTIASNKEVEVEIKLRVPQEPGTYTGDWRLMDASGNKFGVIIDGSESVLRVQIKAVSLATVSYNFMKYARKAEWKNATSKISFGDKNDDSAGVATFGYDIMLEDGLIYERVLGTYPQRITDGMISGLFPAYKVHNNDRFRAQLGFKWNCENGRVKFVLKYLDGSTEKTLQEWKASCNGELKSVDVGLHALRGKEVQFMLVVLADGSYKNDKAIWVFPRIEREE